MAKLLNLPNELLVHIVSFIKCYPALLSFCLVNRHIRDICQEWLDSHSSDTTTRQQLVVGDEACKEVRKWWNGFRFKQKYYNRQVIWQRQVHMMDLCGRVLQDHHLACHIRVLDIFECHETKHREWKKLREMVLASGLLSDEFRQKLLQVIAGWRRVVGFDGSKAAFTTLLLLLLPRLSVLHIYDRKQLGGFLDLMPPSDGMFRGLTDLEFADYRGIHLGGLLKSLLLPSLERLDVDHVFHRTHETLPSVLKAACPLRILTLDYSCISLPGFWAILKSIGTPESYGLREFSYKHYPLAHPHRFLADYDGPGLVEALATTHSARSLIYLRLIVSNVFFETQCHEKKCYDTKCHDQKSIDLPHGLSFSDKIALGSQLKDLNGLRELWIHPEMLVDGLGGYSSPRRDRCWWYMAVNKSIPQQPLRDLLPRSLEVLTLEFGSSRAAKLVVGKLVTLFEVDFQEVPNLKEVNLDWKPASPMRERIIEICAKRTVSLKMDDS